MKESLVKDENHISIQGWMVNKLKLSGNELIIYALIYGFSQIEDHSFHGSLQYISDWTNISKNSCLDNLKKLVDKNLIIKKEKEINGLKFCEYSTNLHTIQETCIPIQETWTNNIDNNIDNIDNKLSILDIKVKDISKQDLILKENIKCIIDYLNESIGSNYRYDTKSTINLIKARFKEGYKLDDFYDVIDKKVKEWKNTEFEQYLRPATLFGNKFETYLNQTYFKGKTKSNYSSKPGFDNTVNHEVPKGLSSMNEEEKLEFEQTLAKDENGNYIKF